MPVLKNALAVTLAILAVTVGQVQGAVTYSIGSAPVVTNSSVIEQNYQLNDSGALVADVDSGTIPVNLTATGILVSTNDDQTIIAEVFSNDSTLYSDILDASGNAANSSLTSVNAQESMGITAYAEVSGSSVTSTLTDLYGGSFGSVTGNAIATTANLNRTVQTVEGKINPTFDSSHAGNVSVAGGDAGLFVGSVQVSDTVADGAGTGGFAAVTGTNAISLTADLDVNSALGSNLTLKADDNSISAAFTGNSAVNVLSVLTEDEDGPGFNTLNSSAGVANIQINDGVNSGSGSSASVGPGSSISASIQESAFDTSSLSFDGNQIMASAIGSVADNQLQVADTLNVAADGAQTNGIDFAVGSENATTSGGLFLNNVQVAIDSPIGATATDPAGAAAALSVDSRGLIGSEVSVDGNSFEAIALANDASSTISVDGATTFTSAVAASNLQEVSGSPVTATATNGTLTVKLGINTGNPLTFSTDNIIGSNISVDGNTISALAVANRDPLLVDIVGNTVTDGLTQTAGSSVDNSTLELDSTAGISAISSQLAAGSSVSASNTGAGINLALDGYPLPSVSGPHASFDTLTQSDNSIASLANINEGLVAVGVDANQLDASSAVASVQNAATSDVSATTSGTVTTGVDSRLYGAGDNYVNGHLAILVGDGDLSDGADAGNSISATAGGNLNAAVLEVTAATVMQVTDAIDMDGASSDSLALSSAAATNEVLAEMSVLTDQRLASNTITATTDVSQIAGIIRPSDYAITDSTLTVDGNQVTATARGNLTSNSLEFSALAVDMAAAELGGAPAGTNLASMGAVQVVGGQSSVSATIIANNGAAGSGREEIQGRLAGSGVLDNVTLSVDGNTVEAAATGTMAISSLKGTGGSLEEDAPDSVTTLFGQVDIAATPATALTIADVAAANAVVQDNAGAVTATLAATQDYQIAAEIPSYPGVFSNREITDSVFTADDNRVVALATGSSAAASTELAFQTQESSAATAVQQAQSGETTAQVGGAVGGPSAVTISTMTRFNSNQIDTTLSASGNTAGAQATGAASDASLAAGSADTVTLASGFGDTAIDGASAAITLAGVTTASADYMVGVQQNVSGATTASADDLSVLVSGGRFTGGGLSADENFLTAQATGGSSAADLALTALDMTADGDSENTVDAVLSSDQRLSAAVNASLTVSDVRAQAINLTYVATPDVNGSEFVSVDGNNLLAAGVGLSSDNAMATDAATSVAGDSSDALRMIDFDGDIAGAGFDRLIVANQAVDLNGDVTVTASILGVSAAITGNVTPAVSADIEGDTLTVDGNSLRAQGTGASSSNAIDTTAGASIASLSQAIVAQQVTDGAVSVTTFNASATLDIGDVGITGNSTDSNLSVSDNQIGATAAGLSGDNSLSTSAATSITDELGLGSFTTGIVSWQDLREEATVDATLNDAYASMYIVGVVDNSHLNVDGNGMLAESTGASNSNNLATSAGTSLVSLSEVIVAMQNSDAAVSASTAAAIATLEIGDGDAQMDVTDSSLSISGNEFGATATGLSGENTQSMSAEVAIADDGEAVPSGIFSMQTLSETAAVAADLSDARADLDIFNGSAFNSTLTMDGNGMLAQGTGASNSNSFTAAAGTSISDVFQGIIALQMSEAPVSVSNTGSQAWLTVEGDADDSTLSLSGNQIGALATGLSGENAVTMSSDVSIFDNSAMPPSGIVSFQSLDVTAAVSADVENANISQWIFWGTDNSSLAVDGNILEANAIGATNSNSVSATSGAIGTGFEDGVGFGIGALQFSAAAVDAANVNNTGDESIELVIEEDNAYGSTLSLSGNSINALANNLTGVNALTVAATTSNYGDDAELLFDDTAGLTVSADRLVLSGQDVEDTGAVTATVDEGDMVIYVEDEVEAHSTVIMDGNRVASNATVARNSNALTNSALTELRSSSLIAAAQNSDAAATAETNGTDLDIEVNYPVLDSSLSLSGNQVSATATGLSATNALDVTAGSMQGASATGSIDASASGHIVDAFSAISSEQTTTGAIAASADNPDVFALAWGVYDSTLDVDNNTLQASSTAATVTNTIMQLTETSMADAPVMLAATQTISGSSMATMTNADVYVYINGDDEHVHASNISVDGNTVQAVAMGGSMTNFIDPASGTSMDNYGQADPSVDGTSSQFIGTYGLVSRQTSTAPVTALHEGNTEVELEIAADADADSALSVSGNILRSQATNLSADNGIVVAADTSLNYVTSGILSFQDVLAETRATTSGSDVWVDAYELDGTAAVDSNWLLAVATGGSVTNELAVSALSVSGDSVGASNTLDTTVSGGVSAISGNITQVSLLNAQNRDAAVIAEQNDDDGDLEVSAYFDNVTGSVSVSNNLMASEARGLVVSNTLSLTADTVIDGGSLALGSVQSASGNASVDASITGDNSRFTLNADDLTGTATLDGNTALAAATSNLAINSLTATAGTVMSNLGSEATATATAPPAGATSSSAGFALQNSQHSSGDVTATITNLSVDMSLASLTGTATVDGNSVLSSARGSAAQNSLVLNAGTDLQASASVVNAQVNSGAISASITGSVVAPTGINLNVSGAALGTTSVSNNTVQASSTATYSLNSMDVTGTLVPSTGGSAGPLTATADFVAINAQANVASVSSSVSNYTIGLNATSMNGTASVEGNSILADATGNSSTNRFTINTRGGYHTADFSFSGNQSNSGNISSTISGASISLSSGGAAGTFKSSGNRIGATSIGNMSISSIKANQ